MRLAKNTVAPSWRICIVKDFPTSQSSTAFRMDNVPRQPKGLQLKVVAGNGLPPLALVSRVPGVGDR